MYIGIFDLFKIGIGPSSSHTVGPMRAARRFALELPAATRAQIARVQVSLHGSLAHTGRGHGTHDALVLGLAGELPDRVDVDAIAARIADVRARGALTLLGERTIAFDPDADIVFNRTDLLPVHTNGMSFRAFDAAGGCIAERRLYSVGGGFVVDEDEAFVGTPVGTEGPVVPYPFDDVATLLSLGREHGLSFAEMLHANECALRPAVEVDAWLDHVREAMFACIERGMAHEGMLPGGLNVRRRARGLAETLRASAAAAPMLGALQWVNAWAIAVNEENAAGGRVVTAPTNGAAGVVPAVLRYCADYCAVNNAGLRRFVLVAAAIGSLCKRNASISGAEVGCQGEVGSASAMAAGGLAAALGASNERIENAAEIALEHHLGMTCDPVGGLVQIPCIERNAMGAVKSINAAMLALAGDGIHKVSLDQAIETMRRTGADMHTQYKETSLGGLAVAVPEC